MNAVEELDGTVRNYSYVSIWIPPGLAVAVPMCLWWSQHAKTCRQNVSSWILSCDDSLTHCDVDVFISVVGMPAVHQRSDLLSRRHRLSHSHTQWVCAPRSAGSNRGNSWLGCALENHFCLLLYRVTGDEWHGSWILLQWQHWMFFFLWNV